MINLTLTIRSKNKNLITSLEILTYIKTIVLKITSFGEWFSQGNGMKYHKRVWCVSISVYEYIISLGKIWLSQGASGDYILRCRVMNCECIIYTMYIMDDILVNGLCYVKLFLPSPVFKPTWTWSGLKYYTQKSDLLEFWISPLTKKLYNLAHNFFKKLTLIDMIILKILIKLKYIHLFKFKITFVTFKYK